MSADEVHLSANAESSLSVDKVHLSADAKSGLSANAELGLSTDGVGFECQCGVGLKYRGNKMLKHALVSKKRQYFSNKQNELLKSKIGSVYITDNIAGDYSHSMCEGVVSRSVLQSGMLYDGVHR